MAGPVSARPSALRPCCRGVAKLAAVLSLLACGGLIALAPAAAQQELQFPQRPPPPKKSKIALDREKSGQKQMLVQASEIDYDYANNRVAAVGNVQIYYGGSTLEANRVVYDQKTKRLHAEGNVRLTEEDGKVTYGEIMDLSDEYDVPLVDEALTIHREERHVVVEGKYTKPIEVVPTYNYPWPFSWTVDAMVSTTYPLVPPKK